MFRGASAAACAGVGGWAVGAVGGGSLLSVAIAAASCDSVVRVGKAGHAESLFQMGEAAEMTAGVAPLHGAVAAQVCVFLMTTAHRKQRRLLRVPRTSAKTET